LNMPIKVLPRRRLLIATTSINFDDDDDNANDTKNELMMRVPE